MIRLRHIAALAIAVCLAHPAAGQGLETAARDAQRYVDCIDSLDTACLSELTHPGFLTCDAYARLSSLILMRDWIENVQELGDFERGYWHMETAAPVAIEADSTRLFAFVPFRVTTRINHWSSRTGFLLGVSENDGESWQFIEDPMASLIGVDRIVPGYTGVPPLTVETRDPAADPPPAESEYLATRAAGFVLGTGEGDASIRLAFEVRKRVRSPLNLFVAFENPRSATEPIVVSSVLMPGQESLDVASPQISGFLEKQYYMAVVFGLDAETEEIEFEHQQRLRYFPVADYHDEVLPAIAGPPIENMRLFMPGGGGYILSGSSRTRSSRGVPSSSGALSGGDLANRPIDGTSPPIPGCAQ